MKLTCGNENQDSKYVVQTTMCHDSFDEVSVKWCKMSVVSNITERKRKSLEDFCIVIVSFVVEAWNIDINYMSYRRTTVV